MFDWRETINTNVERLATAAAKTQAYGVQVHDDLKAVIILANGMHSATNMGQLQQHKVNKGSTLEHLRGCDDLGLQ